MKCIAASLWLFSFGLRPAPDCQLGTTGTVPIACEKMLPTIINEEPPFFILLSFCGKNHQQCDKYLWHTSTLIRPLVMPAVSISYSYKSSFAFCVVYLLYLKLVTRIRSYNGSTREKCLHIIRSNQTRKVF